MIDQYPPANGVLTSLIWRKTMSGGETSLSGYDNASQALSYTPGQEQVYLNGILLVRGDDYTATNGTSITGLSALAANDFVQVNCYNNFSVASVPTTSLTGTVSNAQLANSSITINGSAVSLGGSVSLPGDIESVSAGTGLTGGGTSGAVTLGLSTPVATTNGGTGLSSFTTGDLVYASASNTLATRSIGSTGQVLTVSGGVPTWATASSGGMTLIQTLTLSGSSVTSSTLPTSYKNLYIEAIDYSASTPALLTMRPNNDSGANYTGFSVRFQTAGNNFGPSGGGTFSSMTLLDPNDIGMDTTSDGNISIANIYRYNETETYKLCNIFNHIKNSSGIFGTTNLVATWRNTAAITSLTFGTGAGTFTGGTIKIYGVN